MKYVLMNGLDYNLKTKYMTYDEIKEVQRTTDINFAPYYGVLPKLANERGYKRFLEVGFFAGGFGKSVFDNVNVEQYIAIDPYMEYKPNQIGMGTITTQEEFDIMCDLAINRMPKDKFTLLRMTSDEAFKKAFGNGNFIDSYYYHQFDALFLDGLHEATQLQRDLDNYSRLVRKGGVILIHDFLHPTFPNLTPVINNFAASHGQELVICPLHLVYIEKNW
jgi:SAM-dependent methyltransferase